MVAAVVAAVVAAHVTPHVAEDNVVVVAGHDYVVAERDRKNTKLKI